MSTTTVRRVEYWAGARYPKSWGNRALAAAKFIAPDASVLDLGCGAPMYLSKHLPQGCRYTPADLTQWTPDTIRIDLDAGDFPPGAYDYVTMLGVLEYLKDPAATLRCARASCRHMVIGYFHRTPSPVRRLMGLLRKPSGHQSQLANNLTEPALRQMLTATGWRVDGYVKLSPKRTSHHGIYLSSHVSA